VTRCRRRLHETPTQVQKDALSVQPLAMMPRGSESWDLKARRAARSVSLLLDGVYATVIVAVSKQVTSVVRMGKQARKAIMARKLYCFSSPLAGIYIKNEARQSTSRMRSC
jgi:hypothetical protein